MYNSVVRHGEGIKRAVADDRTGGNGSPCGWVSTVGQDPLSQQGGRLQRFTLGLRTRHTNEGRFFVLESVIRVQPDRKPLEEAKPRPAIARGLHRGSAFPGDGGAFCSAAATRTAGAKDRSCR